MSGRPLRDCRCTASPSTKAIARKPSHLGSYTQPGPVGSALADLASWGGSGGVRGRAMAARCYPAVREYYDRRAAEYDEWYLGTGRFAERDAARAGRRSWPRWPRRSRALPPARTLDVACGTGFLTRHLPGRGDRRWTRARACSPSPRPRLPGGRVVQGDALALPVRRRRLRARGRRALLRPPASRPSARASSPRRGGSGGELVITDSARRPDVPARALRIRACCNDGSRHAVFKRWFTPAGAGGGAGRRRGAPRGHVVRRRAARC